MGLQPAGQNVVDRFAGTHRQSPHKNRLAARRFCTTTVKGSCHLVDPLLFFRAIREDQLEGAARRDGGFLVACRLILATGRSRENANKEKYRAQAEERRKRAGSNSKGL